MKTSGARSARSSTRREELGPSCRLINLLVILLSLSNLNPTLAFSFSNNHHILRNRISCPVSSRPNPNLHAASRTSQVDEASSSSNRFFKSELKDVMVSMSSLALMMSLLLPSSAGALDDSTSSIPNGKRYWTIMESPVAQERLVANEALLDYAVGTVNTMYYDNSGGAFFNTREFYEQWRALKRMADNEPAVDTKVVQTLKVPTDLHLDSRQGAVDGLKWMIRSLNDPYSSYMTRDELIAEQQGKKYGFLGLGAVVEPPKAHSDSSIKASSPTRASDWSYSAVSSPLRYASSAVSTSVSNMSYKINFQQSPQMKSPKFLSSTRAANLPVVTGVAPDSPAERAGLVVGDRIVAVGDQTFLGWTRNDVKKTLEKKYAAENYLGHADLTIAKPIYTGGTNEEGTGPKMILGYRQTRVKMPTKATEPLRPYSERSLVAGGNDIVHYELLNSESTIFDRDDMDAQKVGYIRLTRFSRASTDGFLDAISALESAGAQSYIIDLRNNFGGIIQEAMLTASALLRDSHSILCYTLNSRGGFTPHDVEEYVVDTRYPGYLLSKESKFITLDQVKRESPDMFLDSGVDWSPPSSYASLREQAMKRGMRRPSETNAIYNDVSYRARPEVLAQKNIVLLINEGTASSAEVFASALHDNARVKLVGTKTFGKGLIQHTFPMPDGGGLRLTVAEYLTPTLKHVTQIGGARFDRTTGELVGGGIFPDIQCDSNQGIPGNVGADFCVSIALDELRQSDLLDNSVPSPPSSLIYPGASSQLIVNNKSR